MPIAISLRLDPETCGYIDAMSENLPDGGRPSAGYPAHVTLAVYGDAVDATQVDVALAASTGRWQSMPITLSGILVFPGDPSVISLASVPSADLLARHASLHRALIGFPCHPGYRIGEWLPHVALAAAYTVANVVNVLTAIWKGPIVGWADSVDLVRLDTVEVLSHRPLRGQ
jgi:2'-5' RNA ligase